jgi:hypothetical protein
MPASLEVDDDRFARQFLRSRPAPASWGKSRRSPWALLRILEGTVTAEDTGKPIPSARVVVGVLGFQESRPARMTAVAIASSRITGPVNPFVVFPPDGVPYVPWRAEGVSAPGRSSGERSMKPPRGVLVRGKVREEGSGKPVAGARVGFRPRLATTLRTARKWSSMRG